MPRLLLLARLVAILVVGAPAPVVGQAGEVWLEPRLGWLVPVRDLGRTDVLRGTGYGVFERPEQGPALGLGAGVELGRGWALRAVADRSFDVAARGEWRCAPFIACPAVLLPLDGELTRWTAAIDASYRPRTGASLEPVLFAGVGARRNRLRWGPPAADLTLPAFSFAETVPVYRFGAGVQRSVGRAWLFGEFQATAGRFGGGEYQSIEGSVAAERRLELDMGFVGGVRVRLR